MMTYEDIYNEFCKKFPNVEVKDYSPAVELYIPQLSRGIPNAIIVWLKDESIVIYIAERKEEDWDWIDILTKMRLKQI